jgi:hypothetical protein
LAEPRDSITEIYRPKAAVQVGINLSLIGGYLLD